MVICLEQGADLHMAQPMPLPLTVSCFSKIQIGFTFLVPAHPGSPSQRAVKRACVRACVFALLYDIFQDVFIDNNFKAKIFVFWVSSFVYLGAMISLVLQQRSRDTKAQCHDKISNAES